MNIVVVGRPGGPEELGIPVLTPYAESNVAAHADRFFVVGNAQSRESTEVEAIIKQQLSYGSYPQVLAKRILATRTPVVVTGTHGKTTHYLRIE